MKTVYYKITIERSLEIIHIGRYGSGRFQPVQSLYTAFFVGEQDEK